MPRPEVLFKVILILYFHHRTTQGLPNLNGTSQEAVIVLEGDNAYIDCKVDDLGNHTLVWKFLNPDQDIDTQGLVLTAGQVRVINNQRYSILHQPEHNVWVLKIQNTKPEDSGIYLCEVNSSPKQQIARLLSVNSPESKFTNDKVSSLSNFKHNYTNCCIHEGVPEMCHVFCEFSGLLDDQIPHHLVQSCLVHLPSIARCLTDGRNHLPCCERQNIPLLCRPVCVGNFTLSTVTDHFTCLNYAAPLLACVAEGIETLPQPPRDLTVEPVSPNEIKVRWIHPDNYDKVNITSYQLNVTQLHTFDGIGMRDKKTDNIKLIDNQSTPSLYGLQMTLNINANMSEFTIKELKPFTMYEIVMKSMNKIGTSISTNSIRSLTLLSNNQREPSGKIPNEPDPVLPDIRKCCEDDGVILDRCLDTLCDPTKSDQASLSDLMICAPWANITFKCMSMANGKDKFVDHSNCCQQRGVSDVCLPLCQGKVKKIDFRHFVCLDHMADYSSCILEYHQVLASEPIDFNIVSVHHDWAVLRWKPPKKLAHTVQSYHIHWREAASEEANTYFADVAKKSPFLLDHLKPGFRYEAFVSAVNKFGVSQPSVRILFSTPPIQTDELIESEVINNGYNETTCCERALLSTQCMPLCSYQVKMTDVVKLSSICSSSLPTLVRCAAGGRNHVGCCRRKDVSESCLNVCAGIVDTSPFVVATRCSNDFGRIIQCMEEGSGLLPGMPIGLHATLVTKDSVHLEWKPADEDSGAEHITYQIRYAKLESYLPLHPLDHNQIINSSETKAIVTGLAPNSKYSIYVTAHNVYGVSLPSLILMVTTPSDGNETKVVNAKLGPPHSIEILQQTVDTITFKWMPPLYVSTDSSISYIIFYKVINGSSSITHPSKETWSTIETSYTTMFLTNLSFNTEYAIAIQAKTDKNETSLLSEIILVWTDHAIPASVQTPIVIPSGPILEGTNITAMCVAQGTPVPMLSMFINGHLVSRQEVRHMTVAINNIDRNITSIICYASNNASQTSLAAQSSLNIRVRFKPSVSALMSSSSAFANGAGRLICQITSNPQSNVKWQKQNFDELAEIKHGENIDFVIIPHSDLPSTWIHTLVIKQTTLKDDGNYICSAENEYGKAEATINLSVISSGQSIRNATECCNKHEISQQCLSVCSLDIDIEQALSKPECFGELDKLMNCAADGSDHRQCCRRRNVPSGCLRWCAGLRVNIPSLCVLSSARDIISCFQEGKALLPGPPKDVHVQKFGKNNNAIITWSPPEKNPDLVQWYRVFWRPVGSRDLLRNQTEGPVFELQNLESDKMYEFVVKSGNHYGLSIFTEPLVITIRGSRSPSTSLGNKLLTVSFSICLGIILIIIGSGAVIYYYKQTEPVKTQSRGISFENPTYLKDTNTMQPQDSAPSFDGRVQYINHKVENEQIL